MTLRIGNIIKSTNRLWGNHQCATVERKYPFGPYPALQLSTVMLGSTLNLCGAVTSQGYSEDENILCILRNFIGITCALLKFIAMITTLFHFKIL